MAGGPPRRPRPARGRSGSGRGRAGGSRGSAASCACSSRRSPGSRWRSSSGTIRYSGAGSPARRRRWSACRRARRRTDRLRGHSRGGLTRVPLFAIARSVVLEDVAVETVDGAVSRRDRMYIKSRSIRFVMLPPNIDPLNTMKEFVRPSAVPAAPGTRPPRVRAGADVPRALRKLSRRARRR